MADAILDTLLNQFAAARACWFASTRSDGRAHLAPIWHVLHDGNIYNECKPLSYNRSRMKEANANQLPC